MIGLLEDILCAILQFPYYVLAGVIWAINALIAAIGFLIAGLLFLLPDMPSEFEQPSGGILGAVNWFFPLGPLIAVLTVVLGLWVTYLLIRVALRWMRVL